MTGHGKPDAAHPTQISQVDFDTAFQTGAGRLRGGAQRTKTAHTLEGTGPMSLSITNNVASLTAQHNLNRTSGLLNQSLERLSSGLKINRGADGPAALVISEQQRAQIAGLNAAIDNTSKAISMVQTTEGALNEINGLLLKVRSLAVDSSNTGVNDANSLSP